MSSVALVCSLRECVLLLVSQWNRLQSGNSLISPEFQIFPSIYLPGLPSVRLVLQRRLSESRGTLREQQRAVQGQGWQPNLSLDRSNLCFEDFVIFKISL
jgi:hypothetical protein